MQNMTELSVWTLLNPLLILCSRFYSLIFKLSSWINFCISDRYSTSSCCHSGFCLIIHKTIRHTPPQRRQRPFVYLAEVTQRTSNASLVPVHHLNDITLTMSNCFSVFCLTLQRLFIRRRPAPSPALERGNFWIKWYAPTATEATRLAAPNKTHHERSSRMSKVLERVELLGKQRRFQKGLSSFRGKSQQGCPDF